MADMLLSALRFGRREVWPRRYDILVSTEFLVAILVVDLYLVAINYDVQVSTTTGTALSLIATYAAIAFGFALAGLSLVLGMGNAQFASLLTSHRTPGKVHSPLADLLFIFAWNAIVHWVLVTVSIGMLLLFGEDVAFITWNQGPARLIWTTGLLGLLTYALCDFLNVVISLAECGGVYVKFLAQSGSVSLQHAANENRGRSQPTSPGCGNDHGSDPS